ncbi:RsmD family RNA methyltransferase [Lentisphaera marina]|uniref:RsmD family RNA methyltransferase n=1 Tax=Lentisphaera marina TaxID=1111041 RepID=UPI002367047B|nr:RsmD family RNA methyltransferase [Lentisphaera marina]MDD7985696.1 RsmD family RNA methyltransferase [Lentisphaera marina]
MTSPAKNIYFLKLQEFYLPLAELESQSFFGFEISSDQRFVFSNEQVDISDSAFFDWGGEIIIQESNFEAYLEALKNAQVQVCDARIETPSAGKHPKIKKDVLFEVLEYIEGTFNLSQPKERYAICRDHENWYFVKIFTEKLNRMFEHSKKPATFSSALNSISARVAINILKSAGPEFLDCGCGSGSLTLEACYSGLKTTAIDRSAQAISMTSENLKHFNYSAEVHNKELKDWTSKHDSAVIDFPYGFSCTRDEEDELQNLSLLFPLVYQSVFFSSTDLRPQMEAIGYQIVNHKVMKYPNVTRHIIHAIAGRT